MASGELKPGTFRAQQSWVDVFPPWETQFYRIEHAAGTMTRLSVINAQTGEAEDRDCLHIIPVADSPFPQVCIPSGVQNIQEELANRLGELEAQGNRCAAVRLKKRTLADLEELQGGTPCSGVQYYLPRLRGYPPGQPPDTLLSFFDKDFLLFVDESHIAVPQLRGMYLSDRERRLPLVEYGFRLPTSLDYRPLRLSEFEQRINQAVFVSATPGPYELQKSGDRVIEMVNRPTGIPDPTIQVIAKSLQEQHLLQAIRERAAIDEQVLVMVPTKRGAEDVAKRLADANIRSQWLHGDLGMSARKQLFEDFNNHKLDVLVGVQLLREGLDLPRVSLVAILGADETLSRGEAALLQFVGRAARHPHGHVLLYANTITPAMIRVIYKTRERRRRQEDYNHHGISPYAIRQAV